MTQWIECIEENMHRAWISRYRPQLADCKYHSTRLQETAVNERSCQQQHQPVSRQMLKLVRPYQQIPPNEWHYMRLLHVSHI